MIRIRLFVIALAFVLFFPSYSLAFFDKPLTELSKGQKGKISFYSKDYKTFENLFKGKSDKQAKIKGTLNFPKNMSGKMPVALLLHGVAGLKYEKGYIIKMAKDLNNYGIATFIVDSQSPRGVSGPREAMKRITDPMRISDAYATLKLLITHPKIDKDKIAIIGFSQGGRLALLSAAEKIRISFIDDDLKFAAHVAYYPSCFLQLHRDVKTTGAPILMLLAEKDNITPAQMCIDWAGRLKSSGAEVKTVVYKGAAHAWMDPSLSGKVVTINVLKDYTGCQDRYIQIKEDGTLYVPYLNKSIQKIGVLADIIKDCQKSSGGEKGDPTRVREESIKKCQEFLKQVFNMI